VDDVSSSVWEPLPSKNLKMEQILALKTSQERSSLKAFAIQYSDLIRGIHAGELRLSQLSDSSQGEKVTGDDISTILTAHKDVLSTEFGCCSQVFEDILNDIISSETDDDIKCTSPCLGYLTIDAQVVCWLRLISIILNPPPSTEKFGIISSFAGKALMTAHGFLSKSVASKTASLVNQLLSTRQWTKEIPEQNLWEGISNLRELLILEENHQCLSNRQGYQYNFSGKLVRS
jgi:hypothetical protein